MSNRVSIDMIARMASQLRASGTPCSTPEAFAFHIAETVEALWAEREAQEAAEAEAKRKADTPAKRLWRMVRALGGGQRFAFGDAYFEIHSGLRDIDVLYVRTLSDARGDGFAVCYADGSPLVSDDVITALADALGASPEYKAAVARFESAKAGASEANAARKADTMARVIAALRATAGVTP